MGGAAGVAAVERGHAEAGSGPGQVAYLAHAVAAGRHPHLTAALTGAPPAPAPDFEDTVSRVLVGLLGE
ncbi:hypothetical protein Ait01nite_079710 [Actinoplanes italicus]|nr:hypothetical protein Ait01nite_079710 [Actinoplanes italicus]